MSEHTNRNFQQLGGRPAGCASVNTVRLQAPFDVGRQSRGEVVEQQAHPARCFEILVHDQPDYTHLGRVGRQ